MIVLTVIRKEVKQVFKTWSVIKKYVVLCSYNLPHNKEVKRGWLSERVAGKYKASCSTSFWI